MPTGTGRLRQKIASAKPWGGFELGLSWSLLHHITPGT